MNEWNIILYSLKQSTKTIRKKKLESFEKRMGSKIKPAFSLPFRKPKKKPSIDTIDQCVPPKPIKSIPSRLTTFP